MILCSPVDCSLPGSSVRGIFSGKNTGMGCHFLLQGIFSTQGLNLFLLFLLLCRGILYLLSHWRSPRYLVLQWNLFSPKNNYMRRVLSLVDSWRIWILAKLSKVFMISYITARYETEPRYILIPSTLPRSALLKEVNKGSNKQRIKEILLACPDTIFVCTNFFLCNW